MGSGGEVLAIGIGKDPSGLPDPSPTYNDVVCLCGKLSREPMDKLHWLQRDGVDHPYHWNLGQQLGCDSDRSTKRKGSL
jgi:hypothetical protein